MSCKKFPSHEMWNLCNISSCPSFHWNIPTFKPTLSRRRMPWLFHLLTVGLVCPSAQLYEQILAENEKLKAQLRDTDLELADLKLQLEKATQVRWALDRFSRSVLIRQRFLTSRLTCTSLIAEAGTLCRSITAWDGEKGNDCLITLFATALLKTCLKFISN